MGSANSPIHYMNDGTAVATKEHKEWKTRKNVNYHQALDRNGDMFAKIVEAMSHWADKHEMPLEAVKTVSPARWTGDGRIVISFIKDPEWID